MQALRRITDARSSQSIYSSPQAAAPWLSARCSALLGTCCRGVSPYIPNNHDHLCVKFLTHPLSLFTAPFLTPSPPFPSIHHCSAAARPVTRPATVRKFSNESATVLKMGDGGSPAIRDHVPPTPHHFTTPLQAPARHLLTLDVTLP